MIRPDGLHLVRRAAKVRRRNIPVLQRVVLPATLAPPNSRHFCTHARKCAEVYVYVGQVGQVWQPFDIEWKSIAIRSTYNCQLAVKVGHSCGDTRKHRHGSFPVVAMRGVPSPCFSYTRNNLTLKFWSRDAVAV